MDGGTHSLSCARRLRQEGTRRGDSAHEIARTIHEHCSVSLLRAQRLARAWTLKEVADRLNALVAGREGAPRVDGDQLGHWETRRNPHPTTLRLLCEFYECSPADLGFGGAAATVRTEVSALDTVPPAGWSAWPTRGPEAVTTGTLVQQVDAARRSIDRTLASGTVTSTQLDLLDQQIFWARERYVYSPPSDMLRPLLGLLDEVEVLAQRRQPAVTQVRLSELTAMLATLIADALMKLGHVERAQSWYATARNAADDSGNTEVRARVRAQAAMLPFYYGPLEAAVMLSREARIICRGRPTATGAFAAAAEARALAKLGNHGEAEMALRHAADLFGRSNASSDSACDAFAFPERRYLLYTSGTLTALGRTAEARRVQDEALRLYPDGTGIDPALLHFEAALCLAKERSLSEACELAGVTILKLEPPHRTPIVEQRAREVIESLPREAQGCRAARELREIIA